MAKTVHPIIEELSDNMSMAFEQINLEYIDKMSKHIADIGKLTASDIHTLQQMNIMNANITSINKELARQAKITEYRLQKVYQAAGLESYAQAAPFYYASGKKQVSFMKNKPMQKYIGSVNRLSNQTFDNLSKTTVMSKSYKKAVDKAIYAVSSGVSDYNSYMRKTIRETVRDGLSVQYASTYKNKAGQIVHRTRRLDSAVRMNILDGVRSVQNGIRMIGGEQFGADGVEIDAHALCAEDHLEIQGQQYTMEEFEELQDDLERPIGELNCQHSYNPIVMGISVRTYSDEDLAELKAYSNEIIDIDGKEMTRYQASQMMRNLETEMRYAREELLAAKNLSSEGLQAQAERKMRRINKKYDDVCKKANLRPRRDKMFITKTDDAAKLLETKYASLAKQLDEELAALLQKSLNEVGITAERSGVVQGKNLAGKWTRRADEFGFEIEDVINAQGFDGLPKVVDAKEFDQAVEESKFIAQRSYTAPNKEVLDAYQEQLYKGKWYVDCSTGGAQYGQGMYCAADYEGILTEGIKEEMEHYLEIGSRRFTNEALDDYLVDVSLKDLNATKHLIDNPLTEEEFEVFKLRYFDTVSKNDLPEAQRKIWNEMLQSGKRSNADHAMYDMEQKFWETYKGYGYTETLTLDSSAKIIAYDDALTLQKNYATVSELSKHYEGEELLFARRETGVMLDSERDEFIARLYGEDDSFHKRFDDWIKEGNVRKARKIQAEVEDLDSVYRQMDVGSFCALLGYDAINAAGHGASGSYTVILNRTKVIIKEMVK